MRFDELDFEPSLIDGIDAMNFQEMTPVQEKALTRLIYHQKKCLQTSTMKQFLLDLKNLHKYLL